MGRGREKTLEQYLIELTWASHEPWDVRKDSRARALRLPQDESGRSTVSRNWSFLQRVNLVVVERKRRLAAVTFLRETGQ